MGIQLTDHVPPNPQAHQSQHRKSRQPIRELATTGRQFLVDGYKFALKRLDLELEAADFLGEFLSGSGWVVVNAAAGKPLPVTGLKLSTLVVLTRALVGWKAVGCHEYINRLPKFHGDVVFELRVAASRLVVGPLFWLRAVTMARNMDHRVARPNPFFQFLDKLSVVGGKRLLDYGVVVVVFQPLLNELPNGSQFARNTTDKNTRIPANLVWRICQANCPQKPDWKTLTSFDPSIVTFSADHSNKWQTVKLLQMAQTLEKIAVWNSP